jgi:hypothetical protein
MHSELSVMGWEAAQIIAKSLTDNGYDVLIKTDGHVFEDGQRSYMIEFVHPEFTGAYFEVVDTNGLEGLKTWEEVKGEETESMDSVLEGLEHLDKEKVDYDTFYEIEPKKKKKKAKKSKKSKK